MTAAHSSDLARRVAHRRHELGLTYEQLAQRGGMDPGFLEYLEHSPSVALAQGSLMRLARALDTTVDYLRGGDVDRPPGPGRAGPHPHLDVLSRDECEALLSGGGVGHFVFLSDQGPLAFPVNFRLADGDIFFRTRSKGALAAAAGTTVSFEADHIDEAMSEGWSVLVTGRARLIDEPAELEKVVDLGHLEPWPGGRRQALMRIETATISGRRIRQGSTS